MIYISGPMSGYPDHNYPAFQDAYDKLTALGHEVLSPHHLGQVNGWYWEDYLRRDLIEMLKYCRWVVTLPGWELSEGAQLEVMVAERLGYYVTSLSEVLMLGELPV